MTGDVDSRNSNLRVLFFFFFWELIQVLDYLVKGNTKQCQKFKLQKCVTLSIIYRLNILLVTGEFISYFRLVCFVDAILLLMTFDFLFSNKNHTCVLQKGQQYISGPKPTERTTEYMETLRRISTLGLSSCVGLDQNPKI